MTKVAILAGAALAALVPGGAALADVKAGVEAWGRGDYAAAVHEWEGPAAVGDPDAMFNLAQAYRLGRGVPQDMAKAEALYARAAAKGHLQAADTYGLMLFQDGRREAALPYIQDAAKRGDPRSQYLLGIANFNGDIVPKDWVKAYALLTLASSQGLPQAATAIAQMDQNIPLAQRQQAAALAVDMRKQADTARGRELAAADLGAGVGAAPSIPSAAALAAAPVQHPAPLVAHAAPAAPAEPARVAVSPSIAAALAAVDQARQATGTESPAQAGASFARGAHAARTAPRLAVAAPIHLAEPKAKPASPPPQAAATAPPSTAKPASQPAPTPTAEPKAKPAAAPQVAGPGGTWRVQLGAFAVRGNVERLWSQLSGRKELAGKAKVTVPAGPVTKLQAGGFASRDDAEQACRSLRLSGHDCIVAR